jgi:hypoxanthine-guanine phosphoribosyltransferase
MIRTQQTAIENRKNSLSKSISQLIETVSKVKTMNQTSNIFKNQIMKAIKISTQQKFDYIDNSEFQQSDESHSIQRSLLLSSLYNDREHKFTIIIIRDIRLRLSLSFDERNDRFISSLMND